MSRIKDLFDRLDAWRHLPAYQLERRADIFFSLYLPDIVKQQLGAKVKFIIPEFPIRIGEIHGDGSVNKSFKIDYLVGTNRENHFALIELKTDVGSKRSKQDWYLKRAKDVGMRRLIDGVIKIYSVTKYKHKYDNLMDLLLHAGLVSIAGKKYRNQAPKSDAIDVMYIQPSESSSQAIIVSLNQVSKVVGKHSDEFSQRFARSLELWDKTKAGEK